MSIGFIKLTSVLELKGDCLKLFSVTEPKNRLNILANLITEPGKISEVVARFLLLDAVSSPVASCVEVDPHNKTLTLEVALDIRKGYIPLFATSELNASKLSHSIKSVLLKHCFPLETVSTEKIDNVDYCVLRLDEDSAPNLLFLISEVMLDVKAIFASGFIMSIPEGSQIQCFEQGSVLPVFVDTAKDLLSLLTEGGAELDLPEQVWSTSYAA